MKKMLLTFSLIYFSLFCLACTNSNPSDAKLDDDICVTDPQNSLCLAPEEPTL